MDLQSRTQRNPPFQVIESGEYTEQLENLVSDVKLRDELQRTFDLYLPCDPSIFHEVPGTMLQAVTLACAPPLTLFFHVDWNKRIITLVELHPYD